MSSTPGVTLSKFDYAIAPSGPAIFSLPVDGNEDDSQDEAIYTTDPNIRLARRTPEATGSLPQFPHISWPHHLLPSTEPPGVPPLSPLVPKEDAFARGDDLFLCVIGERYKTRHPEQVLVPLNITRDLEFQYYARLHPDLLTPGKGCLAGINDRSWTVSRLMDWRLFSARTGIPFILTKRAVET